MYNKSYLSCNILIKTAFERKFVEKKHGIYQYKTAQEIMVFKLIVFKIVILQLAYDFMKIVCQISIKF